MAIWNNTHKLVYHSLCKQIVALLFILFHYRNNTIFCIFAYLWCILLILLLNTAIHSTYMRLPFLFSFILLGYNKFCFHFVFDRLPLFSSLHQGFILVFNQNGNINRLVVLFYLLTIFRNCKILFFSTVTFILSTDGCFSKYSIYFIYTVGLIPIKRGS